MDKNRISRFEERLQALVEGGFARLFAGRVQPREVALRLARAMEDGAFDDPGGQPVAPTHYAVHLHPDDYAVLLAAQPTLPDTLADHLVGLACEGGFRMDQPPGVALVPDETVAAHSLVVMAGHGEETRQATQMMTALDDPHDPALPPAFLVVDGSRYVPLDRTVINIGRRRDNTMVLDDPRVSRQHCQIRYRFGQFVLYDLGSQGGTFVNNERVSECVLRPGDVIALAGVPLVFVIEDGTTGQAAHGGDTQVRLNQSDLHPDPGEDDLL